MKSLGALVGGSVAIFGASLGLGVFWLSGAAWLPCGTAWLLCFAPVLATMLAATQLGLAPETRVLALLAGSGVRLITVLGGGLLLTDIWPGVFTKAFWLWLGWFYLTLLALEAVLVARDLRTATTAG
ncbi:MAG: hypothetical protein NZO58_13090 [Gemmataceae bacterium]|nr:hypothetical protein [Gemmataceae bacterium]